VEEGEVLVGAAELGDAALEAALGVFEGEVDDGAALDALAAEGDAAGGAGAGRISERRTTVFVSRPILSR
jgi:hypothetical protein